jgi:hypothetical protein
MSVTRATNSEGGVSIPGRPQIVTKVTPITHEYGFQPLFPGSVRRGGEGPQGVSKPLAYSRDHRAPFAKRARAHVRPQDISTAKARRFGSKRWAA